jgi:uncharacterized protein
MAFSVDIPPSVTIAAGERGLSVWRAYAQSAHAPSGTMSPLVLEGFLTALVTCPAELPGKIWLLRVWGDAVPTFNDDAERDAVLEAITAFKEGIVARLALGRDHYRPTCIPLLGRPELDDVREWVSGFWKILQLSPDWWLRLYENREQRKIITPFLGFLPDSQGQCMEETDGNRDQLHLHAASLGVAVLVLDRLKKKRGKSAAANPARNGRCPCGSGRKYKHCCA